MSTLLSRADHSVNLTSSFLHAYVFINVISDIFSSGNWVLIVPISGHC